MTEPAVEPYAPPSSLPPDELRVRPGPGGDLGIGPRAAGWRYLAFEVRDVPTTGRRIRGMDGRHEMCLVVESGREITIVDDEGGRWELPGRESVFDDLPSAIWFPDSRYLTITVGKPPSTGPAMISWASAPRSAHDGVATQPIPITPSDIVVETRGAGNATRQINHIVAPAFPADRLELVEVFTPSGNWSSWPPHKHDVDAMPDEAVLEEIYHYRFRRPEAWGLQRVYRRPGTRMHDLAGPRDALFEVRDGDVVLVTDGYHPFVAAHGDDAYYLNALAGDRRTMACSFDPDLDWVRDTWASLPADPRVPLVPPVPEPAGA